VTATDIRPAEVSLCARAYGLHPARLLSSPKTERRSYNSRDFDICGTMYAISWLRSFILDRHQYVARCPEVFTNQLHVKRFTRREVCSVHAVCHIHLTMSNVTQRIYIQSALYHASMINDVRPFDHVLSVSMCIECVARCMVPRKWATSQPNQIGISSIRN